jgi:glycosyltransferase involved in cell wall biosynthesis
LTGAPPITIVTPVFNGAATIADALASVREQGIADLEHLVIDGGSVDGTVELAERAGARVVSEPDDGLADAMNKGIRLARGRWIGWLNADDRYEPGALRAVLDAADAHPDARWITGRCPIVDGEGRRIRPRVTAYKNWLLRHYGFRLYLTQNFISCPATFLRADALAEVGPIDTRYRYSMDYELFLRLARRWDPVVLDRDLATFRMEAGSLSMTGFERQFEEHAENARVHGKGHPVAVAVNRVTSRLIVWIYRAMRARRRAGRAA